MDTLYWILMHVALTSDVRMNALQSITLTWTKLFLHLGSGRWRQGTWPGLWDYLHVKWAVHPPGGGGGGLACGKRNALQANYVHNYNICRPFTTVLTNELFHTHTHTHTHTHAQKHPEIIYLCIGSHTSYSTCTNNSWLTDRQQLYFITSCYLCKQRACVSHTHTLSLSLSLSLSPPLSLIYHNGKTFFTGLLPTPNGNVSYE